MISIRRDSLINSIQESASVRWRIYWIFLNMSWNPRIVARCKQDLNKLVPWLVMSVFMRSSDVVDQSVCKFCFRNTLQIYLLGYIDKISSIIIDHVEEAFDSIVYVFLSFALFSFLSPGSRKYTLLPWLSYSSLVS